MYSTALTRTLAFAPRNHIQPFPLIWKLLIQKIEFYTVTVLKAKLFIYMVGRIENECMHMYVNIWGCSVRRMLFFKSQVCNLWWIYFTSQLQVLIFIPELASTCWALYFRVSYNRSFMSVILVTYWVFKIVHSFFSIWFSHLFSYKSLICHVLTALIFLNYFFLSWSFLEMFIFSPFCCILFKISLC